MNRQCAAPALNTSQDLYVSEPLKTLRVMVKPLAGGPFDDYLARVPRDHPDSTLT